MFKMPRENLKVRARGRTGDKVALGCHFCAIAAWS
jgi:hypothetical protein